MPVGEGKRQGVATALAWAAAWAITAVLIAAVHYTSGDPDSSLYAGISARLVSEPIAQWIAPEWWGFWGITGPYQEHPVGMFVVPALLGRAGYPPAQAAYAINGLYQVLSFVLIALIARAVVGQVSARALSGLVQLLPIAFVFRVRANQEYAVLFGLLLAVYATERGRTRPAWTSVMVLAFLAVLLVKGVFALMVPIVCALWLVARSEGDARHPAAWAAILVMPLAGAAAAWGYEHAYLAATGRSFLEAYRARQVPEGALTGGSPIARFAYTLVWYTGRVIWFAFPWSLVAGAVALGGIRDGGWRGWAERRPARQGAWFGLAASAVLVLAFSLAHRKADRYIFPVYFLVGAVGAAEGFQRFPRLGRAATLVDRPWAPAALYVLLFLLRLVTIGKLPEFTFWRT
jgi:4-amino-4-deoxy-L-arabinose transferase-like glycosyltransferase